MKYYIAQGTTPAGPFEIEELSQQDITPDTLVWAAGMPDWVAASTVNELQALFPTLPPPLTPPDYSAPCPNVEPPTVPHVSETEVCYTESPEIAEHKPFDWLWPSIAVTVCCCSLPAIVGIVYAAQVNDKWGRGDYDGARSDAKKAMIWTLVALGLSIVGNIVYLALYPSILSL